jgi:hypothetical protein
MDTSLRIPFSIALLLGVTLGCGSSEMPAVESPDAAPPPADASRSGADAAPASTVPAVTCTLASDKAKAITPPAGRQVVCAVDVGSNNVKLIVASLEPGKPASIKDERQCRSRLGLGAKVFDGAAPVGMQARPLPRADIDNLAAVIEELADICRRDGGRMVGAEATQWARDATNIGEVVEAVRVATGLAIEVLTAEQEGVFGYVAATRNTAERIAIDPGSNSFQVGFLPKGAPGVQTVSIPFGYVRAAAKYFANTMDTTITSYEAARSRYAEDAKVQIDAALAKLSPATSLSALKKVVADKALGTELFVVGQDGAVHLAVLGRLRDGTGKWIADKDAYDGRVANERPEAHAVYGETTALIAPMDFTRYFGELAKAEDFVALRTEPIRTLYGEKALAVPALLDLLVRELGLATVVLVPQEMPTGYVLSKLN